MSAREPGSAAVVPVQLQELDCLSSVRIYIPKDLRPPDARQMALKVRHHSAAQIPTLEVAGRSCRGVGLHLSQKKYALPPAQLMRNPLCELQCRDACWAEGTLIRSRLCPGLELTC